eukprot:1156026-Pelagomonas_calceolata.AAC.16
MTRAISAYPGPTVRFFRVRAGLDWFWYEHSILIIYLWIGKTSRDILFFRGKAFALFESGHTCMHCVVSRMVGDAAQLPVGFWYSCSQVNIS